MQMTATQAPVMENAPERRALQVHLAVSIMLVMTGMLFASLLLGFFVVRFQEPVWPPMGISNLPLAWPIFSTVVLLLSSALFEFYRKSQVRALYWGSVITGLLYFLGQYNLWEALKAADIYQNTGTFGSFVYALTWIHAAHMVCGILTLFFGIGKTPEANPSFFQNAGRFWHFLGVIWLILFAVCFFS